MMSIWPKNLSISYNACDWTDHIWHMQINQFTCDLCYKMDIFKIVTMRNLIIAKSINKCRILNVVRMLTYYYKEIPNTEYFTMLISSLGFKYNEEKKISTKFKYLLKWKWILASHGSQSIDPKYYIKHHNQNRRIQTFKTLLIIRTVNIIL